jgi:cytochrome c oxidase subunit I
MPILWQHLFWIFGHPEVYIIVLPAFGVISEVIPTFSRKPLFGYPVIILSGIFIGFMGFAVWSHHMFTTGLGPVVNTAFALTSFVIGIPTGIKVFNWLGTIWGGKVRFTTAMLYAIAFLVTFTIGGITGIMLAVPPFDAQAQDTYFVVAHFHYVMGGGALMAFFAGLYYWFPKMSGRMMDERIGKAAFWFIVRRPPPHLLPAAHRRPDGHAAPHPDLRRGHRPRAAEPALDRRHLRDGLIGLILLAINLVHGMTRGKPAGNDPWDARTLEWSTTSPPPHHDFDRQPVVNDRDAHWVQKYPESVHGERVPESASEPYDGNGIHMPGQSWYPFIMGMASCRSVRAALPQLLGRRISRRADHVLLHLRLGARGRRRPPPAGRARTAAPAPAPATRRAVVSAAPGATAVVPGMESGHYRSTKLPDVKLMMWIFLASDTCSSAR